MKKLSLIVLATLAFAACNKENGNRLSVSDIKYSDCLNLPAKSVEWPTDSVITHYDQGTLYVEHRNLCVNCGFEDVEVRIGTSHDTIIVEEEACGAATADCMCHIVNSFQIQHLNPGHYALVMKSCYPEPNVIDINI